MLRQAMVMVAVAPPACSTSTCTASLRKGQRMNSRLGSGFAVPPASNWSSRFARSRGLRPSVLRRPPGSGLFLRGSGAPIDTSGRGWNPCPEYRRCAAGAWGRGAPGGEHGLLGPALHVQVFHLEGVLLDELAPGFDLF